MRFGYVLCLNIKPRLNSSTSPLKWKVPQKKKRIDLSFLKVQFSPKEVFWRVIDAPLSSYFKTIIAVTLLGGSGFGIQYYYSQYKLRTSGFALAAIKTLEKYPQLTDILGCPLKSGTVFPSVKNGIQDNDVRLRMPIRGKKSAGILSFHAVKDVSQGEWIICSMEFAFTDRAGGVVRLVKDSTQK